MKYDYIDSLEKDECREFELYGKVERINTKNILRRDKLRRILK